MTQISKAEVINCDRYDCYYRDADVCFKGPELELTFAYEMWGGLLRCNSMRYRNLKSPCCNALVGYFPKLGSGSLCQCEECGKPHTFTACGVE